MGGQSLHWDWDFAKHAAILAGFGLFIGQWFIQERKFSILFLPFLQLFNSLKFSCWKRRKKGLRYKNLFEQKKIIANLREQVIFIVTIILNMIVISIKRKLYQAKNTLIKLNHTWKTIQIISKNLIHGKFN